MKNYTKHWYSFLTAGRNSGKKTGNACGNLEAKWRKPVAALLAVLMVMVQIPFAFATEAEVVPNALTVASDLPDGILYLDETTPEKTISLTVLDALSSPVSLSDCTVEAMEDDSNDGLLKMEVNADNSVTISPTAVEKDIQTEVEISVTYGEAIGTCIVKVIYTAPAVDSPAAESETGSADAISEEIVSEPETITLEDLFSEEELAEMSDEEKAFWQEELQNGSLDLATIASTQNSILLFNYADNGNYTTVLNYQVSVTYCPNGTGAAKTAYIKNMGWHFARYGGTPYPDQPLYCIEPYRDFAASTSGNQVDRDVTLDGSGSTQGSNVWYALPQARREAIGRVLLYSNQLWNHSVSVTNTPMGSNPNVPLRIATQMLIYEIVCGMRQDWTFNRLSANECGTSGDVFYNVGAASVSGFTASYNALVACVQNSLVRPSFTGNSAASAPTIYFTGNSTTVTDYNGVLANWSFQSGNGASFSKNGNTLTITKTGELSSATLFTATQSQPSAAASTYNLWYMTGSSYQTTISLYNAASAPAYAYFRLDPPALGNFSLSKTTEDGKNLGGWQFGLYANAACTTLVSGPHTTDANGKLTVTGLNAGTYYVKELGHTDATVQAQYVCASTNPQTVTVSNGSTATVSFYNKLKSGEVQIIKTTNTGQNLSGWQIGLYTDAACTVPVSGSPFTTDESGTISVTDLVPGTYYARELLTQNEYWKLDEQIKTVVVTAGETATVTFQNSHLGKIQFTKQTNTGKNLSGWTFRLKDAQGNIVGEYTTDENGFASTELLEPGKYTVIELPTDDVYWTGEIGFHTILVEAGKTAEDHWLNKDQGLGRFVKETNTGDFLQGWMIDIYSDEACTNLINTVTTGADGQIGIYLDPGTYWAKETGHENGVTEYWKMDSSVQEFVIRAHEDTSVTFTNVHCGALRIVKTMPDGGTLEGWQFRITDSEGKDVEGSPFATDAQGQILAGGLLPGDYTVTEVIPENSSYVCASENPQKVTIRQGETAEVQFVNALRPARIWIEKVDTAGNHLSGAVFRLEWSEDGSAWANVFYADTLVKGGCGNPNLKDGCLTSDTNGELEWNNLLPGLRYRVTEVSAPNGFTKLKKPAFEDTITVQDLDITIRVINNRSFTLPKTGSNTLRILSLGTAILCTIGILITGASLRKKKR